MRSLKKYLILSLIYFLFEILMYEALILFWFLWIGKSLVFSIVISD